MAARPGLPTPVISPGTLRDLVKDLRGGSSSAIACSAAAATDEWSRGAWEGEPESHAQRLWAETKESRCIECLFNLLVIPIKEIKQGTEMLFFLRVAQLLWWATARNFYAITLFTQDKEAYSFVTTHGPAYFKNAIPIYMKGKLNVGQQNAMIRSTLQSLNLWLALRPHGSPDRDQIISAYDGSLMIEYIFAIQFGPDSVAHGHGLDKEFPASYIKQYRSSTLNVCMEAFKTFGGAGDHSISSAQKAVNKYGAKTVARRVLGMLVEYEMDEWGDIPGYNAYRLLDTVVRVRDFWREFHEAGGPKTILDRHWDWCRKGTVEATKAASFAIDHIVLLYEGSETMPRMAAAECTMLILNHDLLLIIGRSLLDNWKAVKEKAPWRRLPHKYITQGLHVQDLQRDLMTRYSILHVFDCIRDFDRRTIHHHRGPPSDDPQCPLEVWELMVERWCGVSVYDIKRHIGPEELGATAKSGCSWFECPRYRDEEVHRHRRMLRCSKCLMVQYCSAGCQKEDWMNGGHKIHCVSFYRL